MTVLVQQTLGGILNTLADAIEGGNTWRGSGTAFNGIPGQYSNDQQLASDSPITAAQTAQDKLTVDLYKTATAKWSSSRWVNSKAPAYWLLCTSASDARNVGQARKVTGWTYAGGDDRYFTVGSAYTAEPDASDVFTILHGFKRIPNGVDIEDDLAGAPEGFDRFFHLSAEPGKRLDWSGTGVWTLETTLKLRLRICKFARLHDWTASVQTNLDILRTGLARRASYDSTYMRALIPEGDISTVKEDNNKIVAQTTFKLIYRLDTNLL